MQNPRVVEPVILQALVKGLTNGITSVEEGKAIIEADTGFGTIEPDDFNCGGRPGKNYKFPITVTFQGTVTLTDGTATIKHFTEAGTSLASTFNDRQETLVSGQPYSYSHPDNTNYEYVGYKKSTTGPPPAGGAITPGNPPAFTYNGSFPSYYVYFYYRLKSGGGSPTGNFAGDFDIQPSTISYKDSFKLHPKNFSFSSCTYKSHQYKIERSGLPYTTPEVFGRTNDTSFTYGGYPSVIGIGAHTVSLKINTTNCGDSGWIGAKTLMVNGPSSNGPPSGVIGFVNPSNPRVPLFTAIEGSVLDLILINDPTVPTPSDPDGDGVIFDGFDFSASDVWTQGIPSRSAAYMDGYHSITMNGLGYHTVKAVIRDPFGATTTLTTTINVIPPNPVPLIGGPLVAVEGRAIPTPWSAANSYSPVGRAIDHSRDEWTNAKTVYSTPGTEIVSLHVYDAIGLKSASPATHALTVKPDLPPVARLDYLPVSVRSVPVTFTNASYSPDGDTIVSNTVAYQYDANNDGIYSEASTPVAMDANKQFKITPAKVGKYRFTVTVREDWGKQASGTFEWDIVNDGPQATFTMKSTVTEPAIAPFTYVSPSTLMATAWKNTSLKSAGISKRWAIDSSENSLAATSDEERFMSIGTSNVRIKKGTNPYFNDWVCYSGNCAPSTRTGYVGEYLGGDYVLGLNTYYGVSEIWKLKAADAANPNPYPEMTAKLPTGVSVQRLDYEGNTAYGVKRYSYDYSFVTMRLSDLVDPAISTVSLTTESARFPNPVTLNPNVPIRAIVPSYYVYSTNYHSLIDYGVAFRMFTGTTSMDSYQPESSTPYLSAPLSGEYDLSYMRGSTGDHAGNAFMALKRRDGGNDIVKINAASGQIEWRKHYDVEIYDYKAFSDGNSIVEQMDVSNRYPASRIINVRNVSDGAITASWEYIDSWTNLLGVYDHTLLVSTGGGYTIKGFDLNFGQKWSFAAPYYGIRSKVVISKDGYASYVSAISGDYSYPRKFVLETFDIATGANAGSIPLGIDGDREDEYVFFDFKYASDSKLFINYEQRVKYSDGSSYGNYNAVVVLESDPRSPSLSNNDVSGSGQLVSPYSLNAADGEFTFDLKPNKTIQDGKPIGFGFRIQDYRNLYRLEIFKNKLELVAYVNGVRNVVGSASYPSNAFAYSTYKARAVGNNIKIYVAGTPLIDVNDTRLPSAGGFGPYSANLGAEFKNVGYKLLNAGGSSVTYDNIALVDEAAAYATTFADAENDSKIDALAQWTFKHADPNKFLNAGDGKSGQSALHDRTVQSPFLTFDRVGLYQVTYKLPDDPNASYPYPSMAFNGYRKYSDPYASYVVVHRKPVSAYGLSIGSGNKVQWTDTSYDPDRWLGSSNYSTEATGIDYRTTRGILERKYYYTSPSGATKTEKLITPTETGSYVVGMAVKDEYGAWSAWNEQTIVVATAVAPNTPPVAGFTASPSSARRVVGFTINSAAYDAEDGARENLVHNYYVKNVTTGGIETFQSNSRTSWTKTFNSLGTFNIRQTVEDSSGATAQAQRQITIVNDIPIAALTSPTSTDQSRPTKLTALKPSFSWTYADTDGDPQTQYQFRVYRYGGVLEYDSGSRSGAATVAAPAADLPERVNLYVQVRVYDGYDWSNWSAARYFYIETNRPPVAGFEWSPNPTYEGDTLTLRNLSTDPDGDDMTYTWTVSGPSGFSAVFHSVDVVLPGTAMNGKPGDYRVTLRAVDAKSEPNATDAVQTIAVKPLGVVGRVEHTPEWEERRLAYNASHPAATRAANVFWAGEAFVLEATATDTGASGTKPVSVRAEATTELTKSLTATSPALIVWNAILKESDTLLVFEDLPEGAYAFVFTITYSNGVAKTSTATIRLQDTVDHTVQVHRIQ